MSKLKLLDEIARIKNIDGFQSDAWKSIDPKFVARMSLQNRFKTVSYTHLRAHET